MPHPLPHDEDRRPDVKAEGVVLERCSVPRGQGRISPRSPSSISSFRRAKLTRAALTTERSLAIASSSLTKPWSKTSIVRSAGRAGRQDAHRGESNGKVLSVPKVSVESHAAHAASGVTGARPWPDGLPRRARARNCAGCGGPGGGAPAATARARRRRRPGRRARERRAHRGRVRARARPQRLPARPRPRVRRRGPAGGSRRDADPRDLAVRVGQLSGAEERAAKGLLARPTDGTVPIGHAYSVPSSSRAAPTCASTGSRRPQMLRLRNGWPRYRRPGKRSGLRRSTRSSIDRLASTARPIRRTAPLAWTSESSTSTSSIWAKLGCSATAPHSPGA